MSHFTVLVIGENVDSKLAPYSENEEVDRHPVYLEVGEIERMRKHFLEHGRTEEELPEGNLQVLAPLLEEWEGKEGDVDSKGLFYWSSYNPKSKWDWYMVGGRWTGSFKLKEGKEGEVGSPGLMTKPAEEGWVDSAEFQDIDWEGMWEAAIIRAKENLENAKQSKITKWIETLLDGKTEEEYLKSVPEFSTYAVVDQKGNWYEPGEMLMFDDSTATDEDRKAWEENFWDRFLKDLSPTTTLTVVDCHI